MSALVTPRPKADRRFATPNAISTIPATSPFSRDLHDEIDQLVFAAYGYNDLAERLVGRPGATTPSPCKTPGQLTAAEELLTRLVARNQERAAGEARGLVRWLRPDYQIPKLGHKIVQPDVRCSPLLPASVSRAVPSPFTQW